MNNFRIKQAGVSNSAPSGELTSRSHLRERRIELVTALYYWSLRNRLKVGDQQINRLPHWQWDNKTGVWWLVRVSRDGTKTKKIAYVRITQPVRVLHWQMGASSIPVGLARVFELKANGSATEVVGDIVPLDPIELCLVSPKATERDAEHTLLLEGKRSVGVQKTKELPAVLDRLTISADLVRGGRLYGAWKLLTTKSRINLETSERRESPLAFKTIFFEFLIFRHIRKVAVVFLVAIFIIGFAFFPSGVRVRSARDFRQEQIRLEIFHIAAGDLLTQLEGHFEKLGQHFPYELVLASGYFQMFIDQDRKGARADFESWKFFSEQFRYWVNRAAISLAGKIYLEHLNGDPKDFPLAYKSEVFTPAAIALMFFLGNTSKGMGMSMKLEEALTPITLVYPELIYQAASVSASMQRFDRLKNISYDSAARSIVEKSEANTLPGMVQTMKWRRVKATLQVCNLTRSNWFAHFSAIVERSCLSKINADEDFPAAWERLETSLILYCDTLNLRVFDCQ